jgi:hypothetical protein
VNTFFEPIVTILSVSLNFINQTVKSKNFCSSAFFSHFQFLLIHSVANFT